MEIVQLHLFEQGLLSLRELVRLLLFSGLFTSACVLAFPRNAPSRRALLLVVVTVLSILPWLSASVGAIWFITIDKLPPVTLNAVLPNILLWLWLGTAAILVTRHLVRARGEIRAIAALPTVDDPCVHTQVAKLSSVMQMASPIVKQGDRACSTTVVERTLVLPQDWREWDGNTMRSVLAHELTHIQRRDDRWLLLTRLLVLVYWWMPWLIWLYRGYVRAMEESCDDAASEIAGLPLNYVTALVRAAGIESGGTVKTAERYSNLAAMTQHHLVSRVGRFAGRRELELDTSSVYWLVIGILVIATFVTGVEPIKQRQLLPAYQILQVPSGTAPAGQATAIFPVVTESAGLPEQIGNAARDRLRYPEHLQTAVYPGTAIREGIEGDVLVEFNVSADGSVTHAVATSKQHPDVFSANAVRAVRQTRYSAVHSLGLHDRTGQTLRQAITRTHQGLPDQLMPPIGPVHMRRYFHFRLEHR